MSARPVREHDQDDPVVTLHVRPERFPERSLSEYTAEAARRPAGSVPMTYLAARSVGCWDEPWSW
jgi:hypothetical protein